MPGYDRTGPRGMGPMTGGGRGYCAVPVTRRPLSLNWRARSFWGGAVGRGRGGFGLGLQRGYRGRRAASGAPRVPARWVDLSYEDELAELRAAEAQLEGDLDGIHARIAALETRERHDPSSASEEGA